jgi:hypothetical protein
VRTNTQGLLNEFPTIAACLCGIAGIHLYYSMSSILSSGREDFKELTPTSVTNRFGKVMVLDHITDSQVFHSNHAMRLSVLLSRFEVEITTLTGYLEMGLCRTLSGFPLAMRAFLATAHYTLLTSECALALAVITWVFNGIAVTVCEKRFETNVDANSRMGTGGGKMLRAWYGLTHDESIPVSISTQDKMYHLRSSLHRAMQLDLEEMSHLLRDDEVLLVFVQIAILAILSELDGMPAVGLLETREAHTRDSILLCSKKTFEGLGEPVCKHLYRGGRHVFALPFKGCFQVILAWEYPILLILCLDGLKHAIVNGAGLGEASHKQAGLLFIGIQSKLKRSHAYILLYPVRIAKRGMYALRRRHFTPIAEARGPHAAYW